MTLRDFMLANPGATDEELVKLNGPTPSLRAGRVSFEDIIQRLGNEADEVFANLLKMAGEDGKAALLLERLRRGGLDPIDEKTAADVKGLVAAGVATQEQVERVAYEQVYQTGAPTTAQEFAAERAAMASEALFDWVGQRAAAWANDARGAIAGGETGKKRLLELFVAEA